MKLRSEQLREHLKQALLPAYIISGDEPLLAQECADAIRSAARGSGYQERTLFHVDSHFDWNQLRGECSALSLFSDKKIVELRIPSGKPGDRGEAIIDACRLSNPDTLILVILPKLDRAAKSSSWFKALDELGAHLEIWPVSATNMPHWIAGRLKSAAINASPEAIQILAERVEGNLLAAVQEIEKLRLLAPAGVVDANTMSAVVADSARYNVFEFVDRMLSGDAQASAASLRGLRNEGAEPLAILWAISRDLRALLNASEQIATGDRSDYALKKSGVWEKRVPLFQSTLQRCSSAQLRMLLHQAAAIDRGIKGLRDAAVWDELLTLALSIAGCQIIPPVTVKLLLSA